MSRRFLVTGGAGFVGANFVRYLVENTDDDIVVLDKLTYAGNPQSLADLPCDRVELVVGDVADATLVDRLVRRTNTVVHFAAESHNDRSLADPTPFVHTNLLGTFTLLEAVRSHRTRFHGVSTDEVYGSVALDSSERFTEDSPINPSSPYSSTKAGSDLLIRAWIRSFGLHGTISRSSNIYGPFQHVEKFIPRQITNVLSGDRPRIYGDGSHVRTWLHVDDHSSAIAKILNNDDAHGVYLIGSDSQVSNLEVVRSILRLLGSPDDAYDLVPDRPAHDAKYSMDTSRIRSELSWEPLHTDFDGGLASTVAWYRDHRSWWLQPKATTEDFYALTDQ